MIRKTALITGASSGIGKELARIHAEHGGDLVVVARSGDKLEQLRKELEDRHSVQVTTIAKDLTQPDAAREIFDELSDSGIQIDYLINNAGVGGHGKFHEREWEQDLSMIQLNIIALTELCRLFLPGMVSRNEGRILNVSSTASLPPGGPLQAVYFATKHYVTALGYGIAGEIEDTNVTVTVLLPGATQTEFATAASMEESDLFKKAASPRTVANDGYEAMLAGKLDVVSGLTFSQKLTLAVAPFAPKKFSLREIRKMQEL